MNELEKAKENLKLIKKERLEFNKSKHSGISGIEARLSRGRKIGIKQKLQYAIDDVNRLEKLEPKIYFSNEELKLLGYKNKADYLEKKKILGKLL